MNEYAEIEERAAQWVSREDRGLTDNEKEDLSCWLETLSHRVAYLRIKTVWNNSARLIALRGSPKFPDYSAPRLLFRRCAAIAAIILAVAVVGFSAFFHLQSRQSTYTARNGDRPSLRLSDGSQIQLDTNTVINTRITTKSRVVTLEKGEAYFEVVHDSSRPFVVLAGNRRISDIGTKFSVERDGDDVRVVVTEGRVKVDSINASSTIPVYANRGNVVVANAEGTLVAARTAQELSDELGWRQGLLIFHDRALADAAEDFNRHNAEQLIVAGAAREIRIGGSFRADNLDAFVSLLHSSLGLDIVREKNEVILSK